MTIDDLKSFLSPLHHRVVNMLARALLNTVDDSNVVQLMQVQILPGEVRDAERFQNYGFTSVPAAGAEAVVAKIAGSADHCVVLVCDDRNFRLANLASGEVAVYDKTGSKVHLKANGDIEITPSSGTCRINANTTNIGGNVEVAGDLHATGTLKADTDVTGGTGPGLISLTSHQHHVEATDSGTTGGTVTFIPAGFTGTPA